MNIFKINLCTFICKFIFFSLSDFIYLHFIIGDPISDRIAEYCNDLMWREPRTTSATSLGSISTKLPTNTYPGGGSRHMVSHSRKVSIKRSNLPKNHLFRVPYLWSGYGSRETFCDANTVSIPWWTSHRCALPRWLLLRDVPFSSYPPPTVSLSAMVIPGWAHTRATWREAGRYSIGL